jgi:hypothetical protein
MMRSNARMRSTRMIIKYDSFGKRLVIGNTKLTRRGTVLVELAGLVLALVLIGFAGGVELGTIKL